MRALVVLLLLVSACVGNAQSGKIFFSGQVREKVDVKVIDKKIVVTKNSPRLEVTVNKRLPASIVRVQAP